MARIVGRMRKMLNKREEGENEEVEIFFKKKVF